MSTELDLVREKAQRLDNGKLADEIQRCMHGMRVAANKSAAARFERRLHIMQAEADGRLEAAGVDLKWKGARL